MANFLTSNGITWTFDRELTTIGGDNTYQYGTYCNGDYWIMGPVNITSISPGWDGSINGAELNPIPDGANQGLAVGGGYLANRNVSINISTGSPLSIQSNSSLLSSRGGGNGAYVLIDYTAVLTVVGTPPLDGSFRPGYAGTTKTIRGVESDIKYDRLARVASLPGEPTLSHYSNMMRYVLPTHCHVWNAYRSIMPLKQGWGIYGADNAGRIGEACLLANCDYTAEEKRDLVVGLIQQGIDAYSVYTQQTSSNPLGYPDGGHGQFLKLFIMFAGAVLDNANLLSISEVTGDYLYDGAYSAGNRPPDYLYLAPDAQIFYVKQADVDRGVGYTVGDIGTPEWGGSHASIPSHDHAGWYEDPYRRCCTQVAKGAGILAVHMMSNQGLDLRTAWNGYALFDYMDRYISIDGVYASFGRHPNITWAASMWAAYRNAYPPVWPSTAAEDTTPPQAPSNIASSQQSDTTINLSWTAAGQAADGDYPIGYRIYRDASLIAITTETTYQDTGLVANTSYDYDIYSYDDAGNESTSAASDTFSTEVTPTSVTTVYINGNGNSANGGTSWTDALATLPATLTRGATYYIGAGYYNAYVFDDVPNASTITIKKATTEDHGTETGWDNAFAGLAQWGDLQFTETSHITFLGGSVQQTLIRHSGPVIIEDTVEVINSTYIKIQYCEIDGMNGGLGNTTCQVVQFYNVGHCWLEHCDVHDGLDDIINVLGADDTYLYWNRIHTAHATNCGIGGSNGHSDGIEFNGTCNRCEIIGNFVYDIPDTSCLYFVYTSNYYDTIIANNIFYANRDSYYVVYLGGHTRCKFYNNIVWGYYNGIVASDSGLGIIANNTSLDIRNNICNSINTFGIDWDAATNTGDYNIIHSSPLGYIPGSHDLIGSDPLFTNINTTGAVNSSPSIADFAPLNETSPSIDAGVTINEVAFDIQHNGRPAGSNYDVGAFEYAGSVQTTGACCNPATGECSITTEGNCAYTWLGAGSTCSTCATPLPIDGLVASFSCNETSGTLVNDASGQGNDGTLINGAAFSGVGEAVFASQTSALQFPTTGMNYYRGTIAMSFYADTVDQIPPSYTYSSRFLFGQGIGWWSDRIQIYQDNGYLNVGIGDNHFAGLNLFPLVAQQWYHAALTWQDSGISIVDGNAIGTPTGNGTWILYVDGIQAGTGVYSGLTTLHTVADFGNSGSDATPHNLESFSGQLDFCKVYNNQLDAFDILDLAFNDNKRPLPIPPTIDPPTVFNSVATDILATGATLNGGITDDGGETPLVTVYYGTTDGLEVAGDWDSSIALGGTPEEFSLPIGSLIHNTTYYFTTYAENSGGSNWANSSGTFDTLEITAPTLTQDAATNVAITTATVSGDITDGGNETVAVLLYYGESDGVTTPGSWDEFVAVTLETDNSFSYDLTGLTDDTPQFFRFFASNLIGGDTWGSATLTFDTLPTGAPTIENRQPTEIKGFSAIIAGEVTDVGDENPIVTIYWGKTDGGTTASNWQYSASFGVETGAFDILLTGLSLATIYAYRAFAINSFGEDWADTTQSFSTLVAEPISPDPNEKSDGFIWGHYDNAYEIVTPYSETDVFDIHKVSRGDVTYMAHEDHWPRKLTRLGDKDWTIEEIDFVGGPFLLMNKSEDETIQYVNGTGGTTGNYYDTDNTGTLNAIGNTPFLEEMVGSLWLVQHTRQDNTIDSANNHSHSTPTGDGVRVKGDWQFDVSNMSGGTPIHTAKIWRRAVPGEWQEFKHFSAATLASGTEDENNVFYTWTDDDSAVEGVFTAQSQINKGIVKITSFVSTSQVTCIIQAPVYQASGVSDATSMWAEGAWNNYRGFPKTVTFYGNRLWWAGTTYNPQGIWGSRVGYYEDHTPGVVDSDAVGAVISDNDVSSIEWITAGQAFIIGSAKKEYIASAADKRDPITPKDMYVKPHSTNGSKHIKPVEIGGGIMYAQRIGYKMLVLSYEYLNDAYDSIDTNRLTPHMFKRSAIDISKQGTPETVIWVTRADGTLCIFRYSKKEEIASWARIVTGSELDDPTHAFISTAVIAGTTEDRVWTVVERIVNGITYYYIERFAYRNHSMRSDSLYLDCAQSVTTDSLGTLSRLYYLEGHTVTVVKDAEPIGTYIITAGQIMGLEANTEYLVGLPYLCRMQTMAFAIPGQVTEGTIKRCLGVMLRTVRTSGGQAGSVSHGQANMVDLSIPYSLKAADTEAFGEGGYTKENRVVLEFNEPYPATVLAIVFEMEIIP